MTFTGFAEAILVVMRNNMIAIGDLANALADVLTENKQGYDQTYQEKKKPWKKDRFY